MTESQKTWTGRYLEFFSPHSFASRLHSAMKSTGAGIVYAKFSSTMMRYVAITRYEFH